MNSGGGLGSVVHATLPPFPLFHPFLLTPLPLRGLACLLWRA